MPPARHGRPHWEVCGRGLRYYPLASETYRDSLRGHRSRPKQSKLLTPPTVTEGTPCIAQPPRAAGPEPEDKAMTGRALPSARATHAEAAQKSISAGSKPSQGPRAPYAYSMHAISNLTLPPLPPLFRLRDTPLSYALRSSPYRTPITSQASVAPHSKLTIQPTGCFDRGAPQGTVLEVRSQHIQGTWEVNTMTPGTGACQRLGVPRPQTPNCT
ncbi:hypothetical protein OH77DRAFT_1431801 [Trametes cingulata]|nr:hypothetical protein OH77DRAFT_1431801 [Trametes cingulata]